MMGCMVIVCLFAKIASAVANATLWQNTYDFLTGTTVLLASGIT